MNSDPEVRSHRTRRTFTIAQREAILAEYDACETASDRAGVIRRHAIYSSHLANWRKQLVKVEPPKKRGRPANPLTSEVQKLRDQVARLERPAAKAENIVDASRAIVARALLATSVLQWTPGKWSPRRTKLPARRMRSQPRV